MTTLAQATIDAALNVPAHDEPTGVGRAVIDGSVVIYPLDHPPAWLAPVLAACDENGNTAHAQ